MSTIQDRAAEAKAKMQVSNPSTPPVRASTESGRIPMSAPMQKLQVPEIPGFHLHWMRGSAQRIAQAQRAGYDFVRPDEVSLNPVALGGDASRDGNTDLGDRVSVADGSVDDQGQAVRLYLMKQPLEFYIADLRIVGDRNDGIAEALTQAYRTGQVGGAAPGETREDAENRYVDKARTKIPDLFRKKVAKPAG